MRLDAPALIFRLIEAAINLRSRCTAIATGDQAIFMTRDIFERVGGVSRDRTDGGRGNVPTPAPFAAPGVPSLDGHDIGAPLA